MKNILLITSCLLILTACTTTPIKTSEKPVVSSEVITNTPTATPTKTPTKTIPVKTPEKVAPNTTKPEVTADDLTKELDSLIDAIVSSK